MKKEIPNSHYCWNPNKIDNETNTRYANRSESTRIWFFSKLFDYFLVEDSLLRFFYLVHFAPWNLVGPNGRNTFEIRWREFQFLENESNMWCLSSPLPFSFVYISGSSASLVAQRMLCAISIHSGSFFSKKYFCT